ncbi:MAG: hypothetical protein OXQ94_17560 [Gemmatimonadota bacterium]|nr:hypothetical protein [Gemmatimonadota bacterium]MDE2873486.1 hypothetical protein [Gemmatimonadota bacterium]
MKIRNLIPGAVAIGVLLAAWGAFGDSAEASGGLLSFNKFECPSKCAIDAEVCCAKMDTIIVKPPPK